jgi:KUP system potassium uptake protein
MSPTPGRPTLGRRPGQVDGTDGREAPSDTGRSPAKRNFNEAAHKLGDYEGRRASARKDTGPSETIRAAAQDERDVVAHAGKLVLAIGALGVVYGDLGTSPLYTEQFIFTAHANAARPDVNGVYGIASLIFWALIIEVTLKYAGFIMRAHNRGDGGIMALTALILRKHIGRTAILVTLGIFGAALFFGDGMITPAISVTSAVGGLNVVSPSLAHLVVPISLGILLALFALQSRGTAAVGWLFGPVIAVFFVAIAAFGLGHILPHPGVLQGLSPTWGISFLVDHGVDGWLTLGGVVLCCTGAEAMYADRGHFGAGPIRYTWIFMVLPAVMISYLGQAAFILSHPAQVKSASFNPFFQIVPHALLLPMVVLATAATIIASQAVLTGSFSVAKQAVQLGFLPRLKIVHTSEMEGQIYVPIINWILCAGVATLILVFQNATTLGNIYGVAVTGTFILNTVLFVAVARALWRTPWWRLGPLAALFLTLEFAFFSANLTKLLDGAYFPLAVGVIIASVMLTWRWGYQRVSRNRKEEEGSLADFLEGLCTAKPAPVRLPGMAVFLNPGKQTTPLALRAQVRHNHALHEKVLIVSLETVSIPHVSNEDRFAVEMLGRGLFKVAAITIHVGYRDGSNVPELLALARKRGLLERNLDLEHASFFVSRMTIQPQPGRGLTAWRRRLFVAMARNANSPIDHFQLPIDRTVMTGSQVKF